MVRRPAREPLPVQEFRDGMERAGYSTTAGKFRGIRLLQLKEMAGAAAAGYCGLVVRARVLGPELLDEVKHVAPGTARILMSGYERPLELAADISFLAKPFTLSRLMVAIELALAARHRASEL